MANPFVHCELSTADLPKAKAFYSALFDWNLQDTPMGDGTTYTMIDVGEGTGGGMMSVQMPGQTSAWLCYIGVDDIAASTEKAKSLGATVIRDVIKAGEYGQLSILTDPTGACFALWQANPRS